MANDDRWSPDGSAVLDDDVSRSMNTLRAAYADLLAALPGAARRAVDVERVLEIDKKLAWQVYRVATAADPLSASIRAPGAAATRRLVRAAQQHGVDAAITDALERATAGFHATVERHAGDRSSFDLMVSAITGEGLEGRDHDLKRTAFRTNRQLFGKYCEVDLFTLLVHPAEEPGCVDMCSLRGLIGLHRLRPMAHLEVSRHRFDYSDGSIQPRTAVDPAAEADGSPIALLEKFCSSPLPQIRQVECSDGFVRSFVDTSQLGLRSAVTCLLADITRNSNVTDERGTAVGHIHEIATPARLLLHDCLIDERLVGDVMPDLRILANRRDAGAWPGDDPTVLLPVQETVTRAGRGGASVGAPEVPRYPEMIEHITGRLGWDASRMRLFRARIEHPVLNSVVWMRFPLG